MSEKVAVRSFESLREADLQEVYGQIKQEAQREYAFRVMLDYVDTLEKLKELVSDDVARLHRWTARELLEKSRRFRLFDAPEYEIRLFEETLNSEFAEFLGPGNSICSPLTRGVDPRSRYWSAGGFLLRAERIAWYGAS